MTSTRYTKADVANILSNVNDMGKALGMRGAGTWTVETMGGSFLYLTNRADSDPDRPTIPGEKIIELGATWNKAGEALITFVRHLHTVADMQRTA